MIFSKKQPIVIFEGSAWLFQSELDVFQIIEVVFRFSASLCIGIHRMHQSYRSCLEYLKKPMFLRISILSIGFVALDRANRLFFDPSLKTFLLKTRKKIHLT